MKLAFDGMPFRRFVLLHSIAAACVVALSAAFALFVLYLSMQEPIDP